MHSAQTDPDSIPTCGKNLDQNPGATLVTPCDDLRAEVTIANPGGEDLDLELELWFSDDDRWDVGDTISRDVYNASVSAEDTVNRRRMYDIPRLDDGDYFVISRVVGTSWDGTQVSDWIPLRGGVTVKQCKGTGLGLPDPGPPFGTPEIIKPEPPKEGPDLPDLPKVGPDFERGRPPLGERLGGVRTKPSASPGELGSGSKW